MPLGLPTTSPLVLFHLTPAAANLPSSDAEARGDTVPAEHRETPPPAGGETPALVELASMTHAEEVHAHVFGTNGLGNLVGDDSDSSTTGSMSQPLVAETPDSDATLSDEDGWMPQLGHDEVRVTRTLMSQARPGSDGEDLMSVMQSAPEAASLSGDESEGSISESSMPALVPADSSDDDLLFDHDDPPADHAHGAGSAGEECVLGMACASCGTPVVMASELLTEQTARLERRVYPYELDFLDVENAWCYSATNGSDDRYDVARFGGDARFRFRVRGDSLPTEAISFFPPYRWAPAACPRCSTLLGWHFTKEAVGADEADEADETEAEPEPVRRHRELSVLPRAVAAGEERGRDEFSFLPPVPMIQQPLWASASAVAAQPVGAATQPVGDGHGPLSPAAQQLVATGAALWGGEAGGGPPRSPPLAWDGSGGSPTPTPTTAWDGAGLERGLSEIVLEQGEVVLEPGRSRLDSTLASDSEGSTVFGTELERAELVEGNSSDGTVDLEDGGGDGGGGGGGGGGGDGGGDGGGGSGDMEVVEEEVEVVEEEVEEAEVVEEERQEEDDSDDAMPRLVDESTSNPTPTPTPNRTPTPAPAPTPTPNQVEGSTDLGSDTSDDELEWATSSTSSWRIPLGQAPTPMPLPL
jgi:hypothetical protein